MTTRARLSAPIAVFVAVLATQTVIEARWPRPGAFLKYPLAARQLAAGDLPLERLVDFSPFYLDLHRGIAALGADPARVVGALQAAAVAVAAGLLYVLLRRRVDARLAAVAVAVFALDRHVVVYRTLLEPEPWLLLFVLALLVAAGRAGLGAALLAGVAAGLGLATRPSLLPLLALVPLAFAVDGDRGRRWLARSALFALPVAAAFLLLASRAEVATGSWRTPLMNPGTVFFEGNNPLSWGTSAVYPPAVLTLTRHAGESPDSAHRDYRAVARAAAGLSLSVAEVNAFWAGRAGRFLGDHPGRALRLAGAKLRRAFQGFRWHDVPTAWQHERALFAPYLPFSVLAALALLGLLLEARRWTRGLLLYGLVASQLAVMVVFYVSARQRLLLVPAFVYFAAAAVDGLRRERVRRTVLLALVALLALALALPDDRVRDELRRREGTVASEALFDPVRAAIAAGEPFAPHAGAVVDGVAAAPWAGTRPAFFPDDGGSFEARVAAALAERAGESPFERFDLAVALLAAGRQEEAAAIFEELDGEDLVAYRNAFQPSLPRFFRGRIAALSGDRDGAVALLRSALEAAPGDPFVLAELVVLGEESAGPRLARYWSSLDAQLLLGDALLVHGRDDEAAAVLSAAVAALPELREARMRLAAALAGAGRDDEAVEQYRQAALQRLEPVVYAEAFGDLFERWGAAHRDDPPLRLFAVQALEQVGRFRAAAALLAGWEPPEPLGTAVQAERRRIEASLAATR